MRLSVFSLFKDPTILHEINRIYGDRIEIDFPKSGNYTADDLQSETLMKIYTTNLKLFFEPRDLDILDSIIDTFTKFNLFVKHRNLVYIETVSKTIIVPVLNSDGDPIIEEMTCPTCHGKSNRIKTTSQTIHETVEHTDDRIIFELRI